MPRPRLLQYSLRSLLLVMLLLSVWLGYMANKVANQRRAVEAFLRLEARVGYDYQYDDSLRYIVNAESSVPAGLRKLVGIHWFHDVVTLVILQHPLLDNEWEQLKALPEIRSIFLYADSVTDADLAHLQQLPKIRSVTVRSESVTDAGVKHLREIATLRHVGLSGCPNVTEAACLQLRQSLPDASVSCYDDLERAFGGVLGRTTTTKKGDGPTPRIPWTSKLKTTHLDIKPAP